jgi:branched-chain amino acid transport system substrate-binding protein
MTAAQSRKSILASPFRTSGSRSSRRNALVIGASAVLVGLLASCAAAAPEDPNIGADTSPLKISAILSLSGGASFVGAGEKAALEALQSSVNEGGGVNGRELRFNFLDDQTTPAVAAQLARGLSDDGESVFLGPSLSSTCGAVAPLLVEKGPVSFCASPSVRPKSESFQFSASTGSYDQFHSILRFFSDEGWDRVAYISATDATGQDGKVQLKRSLDETEAKGLTVVAEESYEITDTSLAAQATRIAASDPDVVIGWTSGASFGTVLSALKQAGVTAPVITSMANMDVKVMDSYSSNMPERLLFSTAQWPNYLLKEDGPSAEARKRWVSILEKAGLTPNATHSLAWDAALLVLDALENGADDAASVQDHINGLTEFPGIFGNYDFSTRDQRGLTIDSVIVAEWDAKLKAWPPVSAPGGMPLKG